MDDFFPVVTFFILFINVGVFIFSFRSPYEMFSSFFNPFEQTERFIYSYGLYPDFVKEKPYILITHMFIHGDWIHLLVNMLVLVGVGMVLEKRIGSLNFCMAYFFSGLCAVVLNFLMRMLMVLPNVASVGASGAIFGILYLGALLAGDREVPIIIVPILNLLSPFVYLMGFKLRVTLPIAVIFYTIFSIILIATGFSPLSEISHMGGILGGFVYFWFLRK